MRHLPGQAAMRLWVITHRLLTLLLALILLGAMAMGALAWRLAQGPLEVTWLARRLEAAVNSAAQQAGHSARLGIGGAALVWEGFRDGVDRPLDIRLTNLTATDAAGAPVFSIPQVEVSLSIRALLSGEVAPRAVEIMGPHLFVHRAADGATTIDLGALIDSGVGRGEPTPDGKSATTSASPSGGPRGGTVGLALAELARSPETDVTEVHDSRLAQLRRIVIRDATVTVVDQQLGTTWTASHVNLNATRRPQGGADATAELGLTMGGEAARLTLKGTLAPGGGGAGAVDAALTPVTPAALARVAPALAPLALLDAAVSLSARAELGPGFTVRGAGLDVRVATGRVRLGAGDVALKEAALDLRLEDEGVRLRSLRVAVQARPDGPVTTLSASGVIVPAGKLGAEPATARLTVGLDRFDFTDLRALWPPKAARGAQSWVTENVTKGQGRDARFELDLALSPDFTEVAVTRAGGTLDADDLTIHWLRPIPPFERARARLRVIDTDSLEIETDGGRQRLDGPRGEYVSNIALKNGRFLVTGLSVKDQVSTIETDLTGPLSEIVTLLRHSRLHLLDRSPVDLRDAAGQVQGRISLNVPLEYKLTIDDIRILAKARLENGRATAIVAGKDMSQASLDLEATNDGLKIGGKANLAAIPGQFTFEMDFRSGPPGQVVQRANATARADTRQLAAAGLDTSGFTSGPGNFQIVHTQRRDGTGELRVNADLRDMELAVPPLGWRKPAGVPANGEAKLRLARDRVLGIDDIQVMGEALSVRGRMEAPDGRLSLLRLDRATLGRTQGQGTVNFLPSGGTAVTITGESVDLGPRLTTSGTAEPPANAREPQNRPWSVDARFNQALVANGAVFTGVSFRADSDGMTMRRLRLDGRTGDTPFAVEIAPEGTGRRLSANTANAGALLNGLDVIHRMVGGKLTVNASYDDRTADHPLTGTAEITDFRVANAPALARLLQAISLYGLLELAQGPGLGFTRLVAPFRLTDASLEVTDARAFGPSIGVTLKGRLDRKREILAMDGTVVPAHFFNSLLGDLPVLGRLFSPEPGGGLVAFSFTLRGPLNDPQVSVNPLSALTPGFLRGLFKL